MRGSTALVGLGVVGFALVSGARHGFGRARLAALAAGVMVGALALFPARWRERALLVLLATAVSLGLAEGVLRVAFAPYYASIYQLDPRWLHKLIPGAKKYFKHQAINGGRTVLVDINSEGFRGKELRRDGGRRVVVYGDSTIEAEFSELPDTFAARLEAELGDAEVVNAGVVAYGPDQVSARMEDELPRLHPDLVIVAVFADNDYGDLIRDKMFRLDPQGALVTNPFVLGETLKASFAQGPFLFRMLTKALRPRRVTRAHDERGSAASLERKLRLCQEEYRNYVVDGDNEVTKLFQDRYDADVSLTPDSDSARYKRRLMEQVLRRIDETARRDQARLLLLIVPSLTDVCEGCVHVDMDRYPAYKRSTLTDVIEDIASRNGIPYVNLFGPFRERGRELLYLRGGDDHWNDAGQRLGAEIVADYVRAHALLR